MNSLDRILIVGASGYVGGRLASALSGRLLRCVARRPKEAALRLPTGAEIVKADVLDPDSLKSSLKGVHTAYYLVHSMGDGDDFERLEKEGAENFAHACVDSKVKRIFYLGGLADSTSQLSAHLRSRHEVGHVLRSSGIEVVEFRASIVIGSGSLSFEMVRALTEKLPIMVTPRWVRIKSQPIAIEDLILYLVQALELSPGPSRVIEIGGRDVVSYGDLMSEYARQRGLLRVCVPVPFLTPRLSSLWLGLVTPLYARIGHKLITSIKNASVVRDVQSAQEFGIEPMGCEEAIRRALSKEDQEFGNTHWSDALSSLGPSRSWAGVQFGNRIVDSRQLEVEASIQKVFYQLQILGGNTGWYFGNLLWKIRGFLDRLVGGPGLRRGRAHPVRVKVGDAIDFWRVEAYEENRKLRLYAEMKLPGRAWLEFTTDRSNGKTLLRQTAIFDPIGLMGRAYWYLLYPIHSIIFRGMLREIASRSLRRHQVVYP